MLDRKLSKVGNFFQKFVRVLTNDFQVVFPLFGNMSFFPSQWPPDDVCGSQVLTASRRCSRKAAHGGSQTRGKAVFECGEGYRTSCAALLGQEAGLQILRQPLAFNQRRHQLQRLSQRRLRRQLRRQRRSRNRSRISLCGSLRPSSSLRFR